MRFLEHVGEIASILFFLMGAMAVVELVDVHEGFRVDHRSHHGEKEDHPALDREYHRFFPLGGTYSYRRSSCVRCSAS